MLTGELPFKALSAPETLNAIIHEPTPRLDASLAGDLTSELQRVLDKCLAKDPGERYQTVRDLAVDLRGARRRLESASLRASPMIGRAILPSSTAKWPSSEG